METVKKGKLVKDYKGDLILKSKARSIFGKYYEEGISCFLMEDGQWYRVTSEDKIIYDNYYKKYVLRDHNKLIKGYINNEKEIGYFSPDAPSVRCFEKGDTSGSMPAMTEEIAKMNGYIESINNGNFYNEKNLTDNDIKTWFNKKCIPDKERSKNYNLDANLDARRALEDKYAKLDLKISKSSREFAKFIGDLTFGIECEVINGFIPSRVRERLGIKALKDGSLRSDNGEGIEYVSVPMSGAKGIQVIKELCYELTRRCEVNNYCSVHFHFGNVRKDKLFVLSLYKLITHLQKEIISYFPYSRFHSIKPDGKVYCNPLDGRGIDYNKLFKSTNEEDFKNNVFTEFNKIYSWLNNGVPLGNEYGQAVVKKVEKIIDGKAMFGYKWFRNVYTTKSINNAVNGEKWNKTCRYSIVNFLNMFFSNSGTVEFRPHEGSTNSTKILIWFLTCASIIKYAYNISRCMKLTSIKLSDVLEENLGKDYTEYIMAYFSKRHNIFFTESGEYKKNFNNVESAWFKDDPSFTFIHNNTEIR